MYEVAIEILNIINDNGYEAYIIGGFVRDKLLKIESTDIDIATNAKPSELLAIFENIKINEQYASCIINYRNYNFEVTTYRKDYYNNTRWPDVQFVNTLKEDIDRRDFTINSITIDKGGNYIDLINGIEDINNRVIRCIGNPIDKLREDPLRILRAIRFMCTLDFNLDNELIEAIKINIELLDSLSYFRKKEELDYIFKSPFLNKYLNVINELGIMQKLEIMAKNDIILCDNVLGIWAQIEFSDKYIFTKKDKKIIDEIRYILNKKIIDSYTVYKYSYDSVQICSQILNVDISNIVDNLIIKNRNDIDIEYDDLKLIFDDDKINEIYMELEKEILYNRLKNDKKHIIKYLKSKVGD